MDLLANLLLIDRVLGGWSGFFLYLDFLFVWGFMGFDGVFRAVFLIRESGVLGYFFGFKERWGM